MARVWIDEWQFGCCGVPFAVGDTVAWLLDPGTSEWLVEVLGEREGNRITHRYEHHGDVPLDRPDTAGVVLAIEAVSYRRERRAEGAHRTALAAVARPCSDGTVGYLVDLDTAPTEPTG